MNAARIRAIREAPPRGEPQATEPLYEQTDIPAGMTLADYRTARGGQPRVRQGGLARRLRRLVSAM